VFGASPVHLSGAIGYDSVNQTLYLLTQGPGARRTTFESKALACCLGALSNW
jgi:hypothetical protein